MTELQEIEQLKKRIVELETLNSYYEGDGVAKLFYGLNRKASEMADLLNMYKLKDLDITDPKDKSFERLKVIWNDAAGIATAIKSMELTTGIISEEEKRASVDKYKITTPESISDVLGNRAGQIN